MTEAQRQKTLEEIDWGPEGKPSNELLEARACMAKIEERERLATVAIIKVALPYSEPIALELCQRVSAGESPINICHFNEHMPSYLRCKTWLREHEDFAQLFRQAKDDRLDAFEEEVILIADDTKQDWKIVTKGRQEKKVFDAENVSRAKLRIDVRFRHLKAGRPGKWGDSQTIISKTDEYNESTLSDAELEQKLADIERTEAMLREVRGSVTIPVRIVASAPARKDLF